MDRRADEEISTRARREAELDARRDALRALASDGVPFLVAGAYAMFEYTGVFRDTKDLDVFLRRRDVGAALASLARAGFRTEVLDPGWIAKGWRGEWYVDLIFSSGNGVAVVDDVWFAHARTAQVMGVPVLLAPPEEIVWSKGFVCERERFDGHDVANLLRARGDELDWDRLVARFGDDWEVLFAQILLFRYAFPSDRSKVPDRIFRGLLRRSVDTMADGEADRRVCRGTLLSRTQYHHAVHHLGYEDGRAVRAGEAASAAAGPVEERDAELSPGGAR